MPEMLRDRAFPMQPLINYSKVVFNPGLGVVLFALRAVTAGLLTLDFAKVDQVLRLMAQHAAAVIRTMPPTVRDLMKYRRMA